MRHVPQDLQQVPQEVRGAAGGGHTGALDGSCCGHESAAHCLTQGGWPGAQFSGSVLAASQPQTQCYIWPPTPAHQQIQECEPFSPHGRTSTHPEMRLPVCPTPDPTDARRTLQIQEREPFICELLNGLTDIIQDLQPHQIHTFYEAVGLMIGAESDQAKRDDYLVSEGKGP